MAEFLYEVGWDQIKARIDFSKHGVDFERAATVFLDPLAITIPDEGHSDTEARWVTMGKDAAGRYVLVVHTFEELAKQHGRIRLISARRPTKVEVYEYEEKR